MRQATHILMALALAACGTTSSQQFVTDVDDIVEQVEALNARYGPDGRALRGFMAMSAFDRDEEIVHVDGRSPEELTRAAGSDAGFFARMFDASGEVVISDGSNEFWTEDGDARVYERAGTTVRWENPGPNSYSFTVNGHTVMTEYPVQGFVLDTEGRVWARLRATSTPLHMRARGTGMAVYSAEGQLLTTVETEFFGVADAKHDRVLVVYGGQRFGTLAVRTLPALTG